MESPNFQATYIQTRTCDREVVPFRTGTMQFMVIQVLCKIDHTCSNCGVDAYAVVITREDLNEADLSLVTASNGIIVYPLCIRSGGSNIQDLTPIYRA